MNEAMISDVEEQMGKLRSTVNLFLAAFEANDYPPDSIEAMYVIHDQVEQLAGNFAVYPKCAFIESL